MNKEDLKQVKEIVENVVESKIKNLATKDELKNLATKDEILDLRLSMDRKLDSMEQKIEKGVNKMLTCADSMAKEFTHWKQENAMGAGIEHRQDEQLENHEIRIHKLEKLQEQEITINS